ncbi:SIS domain-containing protein [Lachnospiraceae bacterium]|nr:SIS domain-containing protein [Lachnospiraceae bacterium]
MKQLLNNYPELEKLMPKIQEAIDKLYTVYRGGGKLFVCGNGGSAADCEHIVGELMKEFKIHRELPEIMKEKMIHAGYGREFISNIHGALPAVSLASHMGFITAFNNDANADYVFAQQLYALGREGDALLAISTSGNSKNIVNACMMAKVIGIKVIGLTGINGGKVKQYADILLNVPAEETARIQEYHLPVYHKICEKLEDRFWA